MNTAAARVHELPEPLKSGDVPRRPPIEPRPSALVERLGLLGPALERASLLAARRAVHAVCARLRQGRPTVIDPEGTCDFGHPSPGLPGAVMRVHDLRFYAYALIGGARGVGEAYALGLWETDDPVTVIRIFARNTDALESFDQRLPRPWRLIERLKTRLAPHDPDAARRDVQAHYDLGNDFYALWLDETLSYSCALFEREGMSLEEASRAKIDRVLGKLELRESDRLLEIGTGWGALAVRAAGKFGCEVVTTTVSDAQRSLARERVAREGLDDRVEVVGQDYRALEGQYDKLVSVEMIEAVGPAGLEPFFRKAAALLRPGGRMVLQAITICERRYAAARYQEDFVKRYIFPGSCVPSLSALTAAADAAELRVIDLEDLSAHYAPTLAAWRERFLAAAPEVAALGYSPVFMRSWDWYLALCEGGFREGHLGTVQLVLTRKAVTR